MLFVRYAVFLFFVIFSGCSVHKDSSCTQILTYIDHNLSKCGMLRHKEGFIYVDVDDNYIHQLVKFIEKQGFKEPNYFMKGRSAGAHITVVYPEEVEKYNIDINSVCERIVCFRPLSCQKVYPLVAEGKKEIYLIVVDSKELDQIRKELNLPEKKYPFHITVAVKSG